MIDPNQDGITHINIYSKGKTKLGRDLTNFSHYVFVIDSCTFHSVEAYWYYLGLEGSGATEVELKQLRESHGFNAKKIGKELQTKYSDSLVRVDDFEDKILEAIRCKLRQNKNICVDLMNSTLPLEHYYCYGSKEKGYKVVELKQYQWITDEIVRLRVLLQEKFK